MQERENQYALVALGEEANQWFRTPVGMFVLKKMNDEVQELQDLFISCEPHDTKTMQEIHFNILVAQKGLEWLNEVINEGQMAYDGIAHETGQ